MGSNFDTELVDQLQASISQGRILLVIGSAYSGSAGVPTLEEILANGPPARPQANDVIQSQTTHERSNRVAADVHSYLSHLNPRVPEVYRLIAALPVTNIVTTSYDQLIERAFMSAGKRADIVLTAWDLQKPSTKSNDVLLVKLLGDASSPELLQARPGPSGEYWRTLLLRCTQLLEYDLELFLGFGRRDNLNLQSVLSVLKAGPRRRARILLAPTRHKQPASAVSEFDRVVYVSDRRVAALLYQLGGRLTTAESTAPVKHRSAWTRIQQYMRALQTELRYSWTVDRTRQVLTHEVPFRLAIQDGNRLQKLLSETVTGAVLSNVKSSGALSSEFPSYLSNKRHILLVGEAGSGKTTFLKGLARSLAVPCDPPIVPFFCSAQDLYRHEISSVGSLLKAIETRAGLPGLASAAEAVLEDRHCVFIIDALDELEPRSASSVMNVLRHFCTDRPKVRYVASCRPHLVNELVYGDLDAIIRLEPLNQCEIADFLSCWFQNRPEAERLRNIIRAKPEVLSLARRPLFLGMLAYLWASKHAAPISVAELYDAAVRLLLGRWDLERGVLRANRHEPYVKIKVLVACAVHALRHERQVMSTEEIVRLLSGNAEIGIHGAREVLALVEEIAEQTGLLGRVADEQWSFVHTSFLDYFGSRFVLEHAIEDVSTTIDNSSHSQRWIPAIVMAASALRTVEGDQLLRQLTKRAKGLGGAREICARADLQRDIEAVLGRVTKQNSR